MVCRLVWAKILRMSTNTGTNLEENYIHTLWKLLSGRRKDELQQPSASLTLRALKIYHNNRSRSFYFEHAPTAKRMQRPEIVLEKEGFSTFVQIVLEYSFVASNFRFSSYSETFKKGCITCYRELDFHHTITTK